MERKYRIHPAIGIARVGDSPDDYFVGPEALGAAPSLDRADAPPSTDGAYKDGQKRIKRQGARFRIYEHTLNDAGTVEQVREITTAEAHIEWQVHLANRKAAALQFLGHERRNADLRGDERRKLIIDASAQTISGAGQPMRRLQGRFMDALDVPLGDLLTDSAGRLIVLGGFGKSQSVPPGKPLPSFANNDGWCDDVSDGPVKASLRMRGAPSPIEAEPAWVIVAPPDFAPAIENVITLYDVVYDMMTRLDPALAISAATRVSFTRDIYPMLRRVCHMHWVSDLAARGHSPAHHNNHFLDADRLNNLLANDDKSTSSKAFRERNRIFGALKKPGSDVGGMPLLSGGDTDATLTETQYRRMERWAQGDFDADWTGQEPAPLPLDQLPAQDQPHALDRAALEACVGTGMFPGIEVGRIMRVAPGKPRAQSPYDKDRPFRINAQLLPGTLTERMAVPWQADFRACETEQDENGNPMMTGDWWPAQRPIQVRRSLQPGAQSERWVPSEWTKQDMVEKWAKLGFVVKRGAAGAEAYVEEERAL